MTDLQPNLGLHSLLVFHLVNVFFTSVETLHESPGKGYLNLVGKGAERHWLYDKLITLYKMSGFRLMFQKMLRRRKSYLMDGVVEKPTQYVIWIQAESFSL